MENEIRDNLAESLRSAAMDLSEVASDLSGFGTDDEIELQARILDRIAEDANEGATMLRALITRRGRMHRVPPGGGAA